MNVGLRGLTLLSKFGLLLFLAVFLKPAELGLYGLVVASVAYATYPLGFEFYTYSTREIVRVPREQKGGVLRNQLALHARLYMAVLPLFLLIFYFELLPWKMAPWFFILVVLEHACQEMMRLLIAVERQLMASIALFVRQGLWAIIAMALMFGNEAFRELKVLFISWAFGSAVAAIISVVVLWKEVAFSNVLSNAVDWKWVRKGLMVAIPMFMGTMALNFMTIIDRYWFETLQGVQALGGYIFFISIAASVMSFLEAGVFSFIYPAILAAQHAGETEKFNALLKKMLMQTVVLSVLLIIVILFFIDLFLVWVGHEIYIGMKNILYIFLLAMFFQAISYVPHYALYAVGRDRAIISAHLACVPVFLCAVLLIKQWSSYYAVPFGIVIAFVFMLAYKLIAFRCSILPGRVTAS